MGKKGGRNKAKAKDSPVESAETSAVEIDGKNTPATGTDTARTSVVPDGEWAATSDETAGATDPRYTKNGKLKSVFYEKEILRLQEELVKLQYWVKAKGLQVCILFEGRDAAGKGGVIKRIIETTNPRVIRVVALGIPSDRGKISWSGASRPQGQVWMPRIIPDQTRAPGGPREGPSLPRSLFWQGLAACRRPQPTPRLTTRANDRTTTNTE